MAGTLVTTNILQTLVAMGLSTLRERCVMPRLVNRDYEADIVGSRRGATVNVAVPASITTRSVTADVVPPAVTAVTPTSVAVTLDQWKEAPFAMSDKAIAQVQEGIIPMQASEAIKSLANTIDQYLWSQYVKFYGFTGTVGTTPFANDFSDYLTARKLANTELMPPTDRYCLIDEAAEANVLGLRGAQDASFRGSTEGIRRGEMGFLLGADWQMTQNVPTHSVTGTGTVTVNDASVSVGDTTLTWDGGGTAPDEGDIFTVAGDTQTYVVESSTATVITMHPAARVAWADNAAVTFKGDGSSYPANLLIHRDAIAFAMAPLADEKLLNNEMTAVAVDEESGLSLRLELTRQYKQYQWSFDALYGANVVRRELGVIIAG